jgi:uncharacterized membrane protein YebE (DUF533 family)
MLTESARSFLDQLLAEGRRLAQSDSLAGSGGVRLARGAMAGGAAMGVAALLLGGRARGFGRIALAAAGSVAVARLAAGAASGGDGSFGEGEERSRALLFAMVAAAKADGHIDEEEESAIEAELEDLAPPVRATLAEAMRRPADPEAVARLARDRAEARDLYAASALLCGGDHPLEVEYLARLAAALGLSPAEARAIEEGLDPAAASA